jgi:argininosuccinate lyase
MSKKPKPDAAPSANAMWGGRFSASPAALMEAINVSIGFDRRLAAQDIAGSLAHSDMLAAQGIISREDRDAIHGGLAKIRDEIESGTFAFQTALEDIHLNVEGCTRHAAATTRSRSTSASGYATRSTAPTPSSPISCARFWRRRSGTLRP